MGRISNYTPSYESCHQLNISDFKPSQSFAPNQNLNGILSVSSYWKLTNNNIYFTYQVDTQTLELCFFRNGKRYTQKVGITKLKTNLNNGYRYYFICRHTGKRCSKLVRPFEQERFLHRTAWKNLYYEKQKESKFARALRTSAWGLSCQIEELIRELYYERPKYQKTHYKGKPTPKYQKLKRLKAKLHYSNYDPIMLLTGVHNLT